MITIFRSTGPVISTRRSWSSAGTGATRQSPSRTPRVSRQEVGQLAFAQPLRPLVARGEQLLPARAEASLQLGQELDCLRGEHGRLHRGSLDASYAKTGAKAPA